MNNTDNTATTYTEEQMVAIGGNLWTKKGRRVYLDAELVLNMHVERYGTGNIKGATIDGADISNTKADKVLGSLKVWWEDGRLRAQGLDYAADTLRISRDDLVATISANVAAVVAALD